MGCSLEMLAPLELAGSCLARHQREELRMDWLRQMVLDCCSSNYCILNPWSRH